jgi:hypothetical protein
MENPGLEKNCLLSLRIKTSFILLSPARPTFSSFSDLDHGFGSP